MENKLPRKPWSNTCESELQQTFETKQFNLGKKKILHLQDIKKIGGCGKNISEHFEKKNNNKNLPLVKNLVLLRS